MDKRFKRRTIALVLASVITVAGSFAAGNFKNSIKALKFDTEPSGTVNLTIQTKLNYDANITPVKKDSSTYIIMLPEINDESVSSPELGSGVESVNIRTMPYTTSGKGYTKITLKTAPNTLLKTQKALYLPEKEKEQEQKNEQKNSNSSTDNNMSTQQLKTVPPPPPSRALKSEESNSTDKQKIVSNENRKRNSNGFNNPSPSSTDIIDNNSNAATQQNTSLNDDSSNDLFEIMIIIFSGLLVIMLSIYWFLKNNNKIAEIIGEQPDFNIEEEPALKQEKNINKKEHSKKIKKTINHLDKMYEKPIVMPSIKDFENNKEENNSNGEDSVIVDLDELFQENISSAQEKDNEENSLLDEFLNEFYSAEDEIQKKLKEQEEIDKYNEELFNRFINDENIKFTKEDISKIDKLLNLELSEELLQFVDKYKNTKKEEQISEENNISDVDKMVAELTVNQNISFSKEDIRALDKIMNVELDNDFVTDLKTDPKRTETMTWEILNRDNKKHNTKEILTLNVKDLLPNLSEELEKYGKKHIESNARPEVVFADENYDVPVFKVDQNLLIDDKTEDKNNELVQDNTIQNNLSLPTLETDLELIDDITNSSLLQTNIENDENENEDEQSKQKIEEALNNAIQEVETNKLNKNKAQKLLDIIEQKKEEHKKIREMRNAQIAQNTKQEKIETKQDNIKECIVEGIQYQILAKSSFDNNIGCYLATSEENGYSILGFLGDKIFRIKHYEKIDNTKLQARESEKLPDGSIRYIVRIGIHKFILDVNDDKMEYVMDLC